MKVPSGAFGQTRELSLSVAGPVFEGVRVGRVTGADCGPRKPVEPVRRHELRLVAAVIAETDFEQVCSAVALNSFVEQPSFDFGVERIARREARLQPPRIDLGMGTGGGGKPVTGGARADESSGRLLQPLFQPRDAGLELDDIVLVDGVERPGQLVAQGQLQAGQELGDRSSIQLDHIAGHDPQLGHAGRPRGFCGTLTTVPSRRSAKQWKIFLLAGVGEQYPHSPTYGAASAAMPGNVGV